MNIKLIFPQCYPVSVDRCVTLCPVVPSLSETQPSSTWIPKLPSRHLSLGPASKEVHVKLGHKQGVNKMKGGKMLRTTWMQSPTKKMSVMCMGESKAVDGAKAKDVPSLEAGFLVQVRSGEKLISDTLVTGSVTCDAWFRLDDRCHICHKLSDK